MERGTENGLVSRIDSMSQNIYNCRTCLDFIEIGPAKTQGKRKFFNTGLPAYLSCFPINNLLLADSDDVCCAYVAIGIGLLILGGILSGSGGGSGNGDGLGCGGGRD